MRFIILVSLQSNCHRLSIELELSETQRMLKLSKSIADPRANSNTSVFRNIADPRVLKWDRPVPENKQGLQNTQIFYFSLDMCGFFFFLLYYSLTMLSGKHIYIFVPIVWRLNAHYNLAHLHVFRFSTNKNILF